MQRRFDELQRELRGELLNRRGKSLDRWLTVVGISLATAATFLAFIGVAAVVLGFFGFQKFQEIETEASKNMEASKKYVEQAKSYVEQAKSYVEQAKENRDEAAEAKDDIVSWSRSLPKIPAEAARVSLLIDRARDEATRLQQQGKTEEAIEKWRSIANVAGEENRQVQARAWFSIGYLLGEGEGADLEAAVDAYTKAIELAPNLVAAYNNLGQAKSDLGQYAAAIPYLTRAIELAPNLSEVHNNLGVAQFGLRQYAAAIPHLTRALELNPKSARAHNNLGAAENGLGQYAAAIPHLARAIELDPTYAAPHFNLGNAKYGLGQYDKARANYQKALVLAQASGDEEVVTKVQRRLSRLDNNEAPGPQGQ